MEKPEQLFHPDDLAKIAATESFEFEGRGDAFDKEYIPQQFITTQFIKNIYKMLTDDGVVAVNTFKSSKFYDLETDLYKRQFSTLDNFFVQGNRIMIATKQKSLNDGQLLQRKRI